MTPLFETPIQRFLRQELIDWPWAYLDVWSIVHFCSGSMLGIVFRLWYRNSYSWVVALVLLALYEVIELFLNGILFVPETPVDTVWDLIIGMAGFVLLYQPAKK